MELRVNDYVRTKWRIAKITSLNAYCNLAVVTERGYIDRDRIIKSSPNIIDLIEEGDILKLFDKVYDREYKAEVVLNDEGYKYVSNYECDDLLNLEYELISKEHINVLSIVTKEQFESMKYKIGE